MITVSDVKAHAKRLFMFSEQSKRTHKDEISTKLLKYIVELNLTLEALSSSGVGIENLQVTNGRVVGNRIMSFLLVIQGGSVPELNSKLFTVSVDSSLITFGDRVYEFEDFEELLSDVTEAIGDLVLAHLPEGTFRLG